MDLHAVLGAFKARAGKVRPLIHSSESEGRRPERSFGSLGQNERPREKTDKAGRKLYNYYFIGQIG